jgi:hypothetical protein
MGVVVVVVVVVVYNAHAGLILSAVLPRGTVGVLSQSIVQVVKLFPSNVVPFNSAPFNVVPSLL